MAILRNPLRPTMTESFERIGLNQLNIVVHALQSRLMKPMFLCFLADMGSGKTTLIRALLKSMGILDPEGSPTYALVHPYETDNNIRIYHIDAYRIASERMALEYGIPEIFEENAIFLVEWPEKISTFLPHDVIAIAISVVEANTRTYTVTYDHRP